jgi:hypothetical protein
VTGALLQLAPALLLAVALLLGRRPGERAIERMRARLAPTARVRGRTARAVGARRAPPLLLLPRGGQLVGAAVAGRPPPSG